jgi:hypothetical protein
MTAPTVTQAELDRAREACTAKHPGLAVAAALAELRERAEKAEAERMAVKTLLDNCFCVVLNANDFFGYACADAQQIDAPDLAWVLPIITAHGLAGLDAVMSHIAKRDPIKEHMTPEFLAARISIQEVSPNVQTYEFASEWSELVEKAKATEAKYDKLRELVQRAARHVYGGMDKAVAEQWLADAKEAGIE